MTRQRKWRCLWRGLALMCTTVTRQLHKLQSRQYAWSPRTSGNMRQPSLPLCPLCSPSPPRKIAPISRPSRTESRLCRRQPHQTHRPCCLPPPALHHYIWAQSAIPTGGGICRRIQRRLPWRFQHYVPSSKRCWLRGRPPTTRRRMAARGPCLLRIRPPRRTARTRSAR